MTNLTYSADQVSNWFLAWASVNNKPVTKMSLQKLLYFSQSHYLAETGSELFHDEIEAWEHGPVVKPIQKKYTSFPGNEISLLDDFDFSDFTYDDNQFLITIWNTYGQMAPSRLRNKTHKEFPWKHYYNETSGTSIIPKQVMKNYYLMRKIAV